MSLAFIGLDFGVLTGIGALSACQGKKWEGEQEESTYIYICVYSGRSRAEPQPHNIDFMQYLLFDPPGVGHLTKRHTHNLLFGLSMAYIEGSPPSRLCSICKGG